MTTSKEPLRCKLEINGEVIKQEIKFKYLDINDLIWRNQHFEQKPIIMTYTAETRPDTSKTKKLLETTEMKILRRISGKTLMDRKMNKNMKQMCKTKSINDWVLKRKQEWNQRKNRMGEDRLVRIARDKSPNGRQSTGRPRKRWSNNLDHG